jgi:hypothetical protein
LSVTKQGGISFVFGWCPFQILGRTLDYPSRQTLGHNRILFFPSNSLSLDQKLQNLGY